MKPTIQGISPRAGMAWDREFGQKGVQLSYQESLENQIQSLKYTLQ